MELKLCWVISSQLIKLRIILVEFKAAIYLPFYDKVFIIRYKQMGKSTKYLIPNLNARFAWEYVLRWEEKWQKPKPKYLMKFPVSKSICDTMWHWLTERKG